MNNPYMNYYSQQSGGAITGFRGMLRQKGYGKRFQRGNGLIGTILSKAIMPLVKYIGKKVMENNTVRAAITPENISNLASKAAFFTVKKLTQKGKGQIRINRECSPSKVPVNIHQRKRRLSKPNVKKVILKARKINKKKSIQVKRKTQKKIVKKSKIFSKKQKIYFKKGKKVPKKRKSSKTLKNSF